MNETPTIIGEWIENEDSTKLYAETTDPRVLVLIERDPWASLGDILDGDGIEPIYARSYGNSGLSHIAGWDDEGVANAWSNAFTRAPRGSGTEFADLFVSVAYGAVVGHVANMFGGEYLVFDTPDFREHIGDDRSTVSIAAVDAIRDEIRKVIEGEVFGVGYAVNEERTENGGVIDLDEPSWEETIECWGFVGEECAKQEAASFGYGAPHLDPIGSEREFRVTYEIDVYATSPEEAARRAAATLAQPEVPERGYYTVSRKGTTVAVDLGEGEF